MNDDERRKLSATLAKADEPTIREILREAESFLAAQLQAGLAADQRAMTLAAVLAAIVAGLVGGIASLIAAHVEVWPHVISAMIVIIAFCKAMFSAVEAARPTSFDYSGSNPKFWAADIEKNKSIVQSMAEQAAHYAQGISANAKVLRENHRNIRLALGWSLGGTMVSATVELVLVLSYVSEHGFR